MKNIVLKGLTILTNISLERPGLHFKLAELIGRTSVRSHVKYQLFVGKMFFWLRSNRYHQLNTSSAEGKKQKTFFLDEKKRLWRTEPSKLNVLQ